MTKTWRAVLSAGLLLALASALTVVPGRSTSAPQFVGTARAADAGIEFEDLAAVLRWVGRFGKGGEEAVRFPHVWAPIAWTATAGERASIIRERAAVFGQRLVRNDWTCATAKALEAVDKFDGITKTDIEVDAVNYRPDDLLVVHPNLYQAKGFVEEAAELGKPLLIKVYKAATCEDGD